MDMQDIILLLILIVGAAIINWSTIKKDLLSQRPTSHRPERGSITKAEVIHKKGLPEVLEEVA